MSKVADMIRTGACLVDVRTTEEYAEGSYPGAVNIPLATLPTRLDAVPRDRPVVVFCASGVRSAAASRLLRQHGYAEVINAGGLADMPS